MKKLIVAICLAFLSVGAYAVEMPKAKEVAKVENIFTNDYTFTSSCGDVWDIHTEPGISIGCAMALWQKMEDACGTNTTEVEVEEGNDC